MLDRHKSDDEIDGMIRQRDCRDRTHLEAQTVSRIICTCIQDGGLGDIDANHLGGTLRQDVRSKALATDYI